MIGFVIYRAPAGAATVSEGSPMAVVQSVCVSRKKGERKTPVDRVVVGGEVVPGDAVVVE